MKKIKVLYDGYYKIDDNPYGETKYLVAGTVVEIDDNLADYCLEHDVATLDENVVIPNLEITEHKVITEEVFDKEIENKISEDNEEVENVTEDVEVVTEVAKPKRTKK